MEPDVTPHLEYGLSHNSHRQDQRDSNHQAKANTFLIDHPAVVNYRNPGVSTDDLASFVESFASLRQSRIKQVGAEQYSLATGQKFETFSASQTIKELLEELADASNYIDFLSIKMLSILQTLNERGIDCD